jgi:transcriptional regulator with XRE-family HTH domain
LAIVVLTVRDVKKRLGEAIRDGRMAMEPPMTQRDLARCVGVHQPSVSAWELGKTMPSPGTVLTLAALLNLDLANLADPPFPRTVEPQPEALAG